MRDSAPCESSKGDRGGSESSRLKCGDPLSPQRGMSWGQEVKLWEAASLQEYKNHQGAEPSSKTGSQCLFWAGGAAALTCRGRGTPAPDRARAFRSKPCGEKMRRATFSRHSSRFQIIFTKYLIGPKVPMNHSVVLRAFAVLLQQFPTFRVQDRADREGVKTSDEDIGSRRLMEERMTSMQHSPLLSQKRTTEK